MCLVCQKLIILSSQAQSGDFPLNFLYSFFQCFDFIIFQCFHLHSINFSMFAFSVPFFIFFSFLSLLCHSPLFCLPFHFLSNFPSPFQSLGFLHSFVSQFVISSALQSYNLPFHQSSVLQSFGPSLISLVMYSFNPSFLCQSCNLSVYLTSSLMYSSVHLNYPSLAISQSILLAQSFSLQSIALIHLCFTSVCFL